MNGSLPDLMMFGEDTWEDQVPFLDPLPRKVALTDSHRNVCMNHSGMFHDMLVYLSGLGRAQGNKNETMTPV